MTFRSRSSDDPPLKKNKASMTLPNNELPDDLLLSCFARVSRLHYPTLSLVSKRFRSLLASPELHKARSLLHRVKTCLYVCIRFSPDSDPRWFTLCEKPNRNQTNKTKRKKKKSGYVLASVPISNSPPAYWEGVVALGYNIYNIGGSAYKDRSSNVSILDCRSHTWHEGPSMQVKRWNTSSAHVFNEKINVAGEEGKKYDSPNWMEVVDPKTQTWEFVSYPVVSKRVNFYRSGMIEGEEIYRLREGGLVYKPKEYRRNALEWGWFSYCVIDNVLYCYSYLQGMKWFNSRGNWVNLKVLKRLPEIRKYSRVKLVSYGGKMAVLWDKNLPSSSGNQDKSVFCAVIALEKRNDKEIWGMLESVDDVLTVPNSYEFICAASPTV